MKRILKHLFAPVTSVPKLLQPSYYPALDGLRGVAILMVLLSHFGLNKYLYPYGLLIDSNTGVHIFFLISGFLITTLLLKEKLKNGKISLKYFYIRRALRILPVAFLFLVVLGILNAIFKLHLAATDFLGAVFFIKNLPVSGSYYTAHFWSLSVEEQFYVTFPFLLALSIDSYFIIALLIATIVPVASILGYYWPAIFSGFLFIKFCTYTFWKGPETILIGSVFSIMLFKNIIQPAKWPYRYWWIILIPLVAIMIRTPTFFMYKKYIVEYSANILMALAIILSLKQDSLLCKILSAKILVRTGILSYSLYIWQQLFVGVNTWQPWMRMLHGYPVWLLIIIKLFITFLIATASYTFEKQFLKLKNKFKYGRPGHVGISIHQ